MQISAVLLRYCRTAFGQCSCTTSLDGILDHSKNIDLIAVQWIYLTNHVIFIVVIHLVPILSHNSDLETVALDRILSVIDCPGFPNFIDKASNKSVQR